MSFNQTIMQGNLTRDNELKYLPSGSAVLNNSVAVSKKWKDQQGQQKEKTCFLEVKLFGKPAEVFNKYTKKGSKVLVSGELDLEQWQDNYGKNRSKHSLNVREFTFLDANQSNNSQTNNYTNSNHQQQQNAILEDDLPF